jgi:hypothetical protein
MAKTSLEIEWAAKTISTASCRRRDRRQPRRAGGASRAEVRQRLASLLLAAASHHHPGTLAQERVRDGPAETASVACHQGHTTVELT